MTLAHPAAVLPLFRGRLVPAALVAGALSPDIPYFLRETGITVTAQSWYEPFLNATTSHHFPGALTVSVPLALLLYAGFLVVRRPLLALAPQNRVAAIDAGRTPASHTATAPSRLVTAAAHVTTAGWALVSLALGVLTHVLWDSFTHTDGWVVEHSSLLRSDAFGDLTWARLLQHASTVVGLLVLAVHLWRRRDLLVAPAHSPARRRQLIALGAVAVLVAVGAAFTAR